MPLDLENVELSQQQLDRIIRFVKTANADNVKLLGVFCEEHMTRLGLDHDMTKAIPGIPAGSDQWDVRSFGEWMAKIDRRCHRAKAQLVAIDATVHTRLGG